MQKKLWKLSTVILMLNISTLSLMMNPSTILSGRFSNCCLKAQSIENLLKTILSSIDSEEIIDFEECFGTIGSGMRDTMYHPAVVRSEAIDGTITVIYVLFGSGESNHPMLHRLCIMILYSFNYEYIDIIGLVLRRSR